MDKMKESIKNAFSETPDVLDKIKQNPRFNVPEREKHSIFSFLQNKRFALTFASLLIVSILVIAGIGNNESAQVYASTVTIDINPSIEITLDEDDYVINVRALNDDGNAVIDQDIEYNKMTVEQVIEALIARAVQAGYIDATELDNVILVNVDGKTEAVKLRVKQLIIAQMESELSKYTNQYQVLNNDFSELSRLEKRALRREAEELNVSLSKMYYINQLLLLDTNNEYTAEELALYSVRELYTIQQELIDNQNGNQD